MIEGIVESIIGWAENFGLAGLAKLAKFAKLSEQLDPSTCPFLF
jgi:hypothetical protein